MRVDLPPSRIAALQPALRSAGCRLLAVAVPILLWACGAPQSPGEALLEPASQPTSRTVSFTTDECTYCAFDISPDGRWIVLDLLGQLWRIPAEGGEAVPLTDAVRDVAEDLNPTFSPDGNWILFHGDRRGQEGMWIVPAGGGEPRLLPGTAFGKPLFSGAVTAEWSPDGNRFVYASGGGIQLHELGSGTTIPIDVESLPGGQRRNPAWLADGRLAVLVQPNPLRRGGSVQLIDLGTGSVEEFESGLEILAFAPSGDGRQVAFFAEDDRARVHLWVQPLEGGVPTPLTSQEGVVPLSARWTSDNRHVVYSAGGRLWRIAVDGGEAEAIPFSVYVSFQRHEVRFPPLRFAEPGSEVPARGHMGLALSPDAERIALLALGRLWVWRIGEDPVPVADVPVTAEWPSWSPDGHEIAWSAGMVGAEDLYATAVESGHTRRLTALPGRADRPNWSPDGRWVAFNYWRDLGEPGSPGGQVAVIRSTGGLIDDPSAIEVPAKDRYFHLLPLVGAIGQERPFWTPDSDALVLPGRDGALQMVTLRGDTASLGPLQRGAAFLNWAADSSLVYVHGNQIWRAQVRAGVIGEPVLLADDAALYPSVAPDGSVVYVSVDGYRLRRPDGSTARLGWPLTYRVPVTEPLLLRNVRIIDGTGAPPHASSDVLLEGGRIADIAPTGSIRPGPGTRLIDGDGRTLLPGLIDLHQHGWDDDDLVHAANLYFGVTTVRDMGGAIARVAAMGEAIAAGTHVGSRVVLGGFQLYPGMSWYGSGSSVQGPMDFEAGDRALALARAFGASHAKMRFSGTWMAGADLVEQAHAQGMRISGHCAHPLPLVAAGITHIEHVVFCTERSRDAPRQDLVRLYLESGVQAVPTITMLGEPWAQAAAHLLEDPEIGPFVTPYLRFGGAYWRRLSDDEAAVNRRGLGSLRTAARSLHQGGVGISTGTDRQWFPGALHAELQELVGIGLSPMEAITAATSTAARVLGADDEIGTIEVGKWADLLLLDADPLEDVRNTRQIWKVIQGGRVVDRKGLLEWARENQPSTHLP